ncbi:MAG: FtsX-like permease family protein [Bryobacterales bacterium]
MSARTGRSGWATAAKIAWRESRAAWGKFAFVIAAVAVGVGALSGVRGFSGAFRNMLLRDARTLMAADLAVRMYHEPDAREQAALDEITARGAERTWITETVSMVSSDASPRPLMVAVKAVDPDVYPFYGKIELRGAASLKAALAQGAVVTDDLLVRLGVNLGDAVRLGDAEIPLAAVVTVEPDRMTGSFNVGPRLLLSRGNLDRTGLMQRGSRAAQRYLFKMPAQGGIDIATARGLLEKVFRPYWIADYRETHPTIRRGLDRATNFLSLVSLVALIVGALGVAMAMHSHLEQRLDTIAILKCIGARSGQIVRIYTLQTLALGVIGSALGILLGYGVQAWAPRFLAQYFPTPPNLEWQPVAAVQALAIGLLTTLLFSVPTLLRVRKIRPALIFRREMERRAKSVGERLREARGALVAGAVIVAAIGGVATWLGDSVQLGLWFAGGLLASLLVLATASWSLLAVLERLPHWLPFRLPTAIRHGVANLHRPGVHAEAVLTALGVGVTFTLSVYLIQTSVLDQMIKSAPPEMPNVFLMNVTRAEVEPLTQYLKDYPGVEEVELTPTIAARLEMVDGRPLAELNLGEDSRFAQTRGISWREDKPDEVDVLRGSWWTPEDKRSLVAVREDVAEELGVDVGSKLAWLAGRRNVEAEVANVFRAESIRPGASLHFMLNRAALEGAPAVFYGGVRIAPDKAVELQRDAFARFPTVLVLNAADVIRIVQDVVDQIAIVVQVISAFAILGGVIILTSSVVATRFRRVRETAILRTLGATRSKVARIFSVEFTVLGLAAGALGALLASGFSALLLERVLDAAYEPALAPLLATVIGTALIANLAGWLASFRILGRKPLEVLRHE